MPEVWKCLTGGCAFMDTLPASVTQHTGNEPTHVVVKAWVGNPVVS